MMNIKMISFSILILGFNFIGRIECPGFQINAARTAVNDVFDYIKPMFAGSSMKLQGYKDKVKKCKNPSDFPGIVDNILTAQQTSALEGTALPNLNGLIDTIDTFTTTYNNLITAAGTAGNPPFQDLKAKLVAARKEILDNPNQDSKTD